MKGNLPKFLGFTKIPIHLKDYNGVTRQLVRKVQVGKAMLLELETDEAALAYRKCIINAGISEYGRGKLQTATDGKKIYVWMRKDEPDLIEFLTGLKNEK
jgi:hypothetical protein